MFHGGIFLCLLLIRYVAATADSGGFVSPTFLSTTIVRRLPFSRQQKPIAQSLPPLLLPMYYHQEQSCLQRLHPSSPLLQSHMTFSSDSETNACTNTERTSDANADTKRDTVLEAIDELYPPRALEQRMALSRKDGYWPYVASGDEPPAELVYGEFDTAFFAKLLQRAGEILKKKNTINNNDDDKGSPIAPPTTIPTPPSPILSFEDCVFCDLGSGTGRLVLTAAALFPWKLCRGVELLEGIHTQAVEKLNTCRRGHHEQEPESGNAGQIPEQVSYYESSSSSVQSSAYWKQYQQYSPTNDCLNEELLTGSATITTSTTSSDDADADFDSTEYSPNYGNKHKNNNHALTHSRSGIELPLAPIQLRCGSFTDPYEFFGDAHVVFVFSSAMPYHVLNDLARALGRQCQPGTLVITTDYHLPLGDGSIMIEPSEEDPSLPSGQYQLELVETWNGNNESTGGVSTVYIQRLVRSLGDGIRRKKPELSVSEIAYRVIQQLEQNKLKNNPKLFLRRVSNQMAFLGLPESWRPKVDDENDKDESDEEKSLRTRNCGPIRAVRIWDVDPGV